MNRKKFIKTCGLACLSTSAFGLLLQSCSGSKIIAAQIVGENIIVPLKDFEIVKKSEKAYRNYLVIQNEKLKYPIYIFRFSEKEYSALYMQCTHQGVELTAYGDKLVCSAHGSEFDNKGNVQNSPASKALRTFPVISENNQLKISLKS
ncbi:MAG: Rieske (2Fe-2S) protein [Saprospiraceae bacterium]|nr:Rieske (2Fe-2S) protein [Saprospiraceae bacterium]